MSLTFRLGIAISASATVPPVLLGSPVNVTLPVITGTVLDGQVLTVSMGTWMGSPTGYSVQWWRGVVAILGATAASYTLQAADVGSTISASVTATNADGSTVATSVSTEAVAAANGATVVIGLMGQSNFQYLLGADGRWDAVADEYRPTIETQNMTFIGTTKNRGFGTDMDFEALPVTTATVSTRATRTVSASLGALSAALHHITPGTQFAVIDLAVSGTPRTELRTDVPLVDPVTGENQRARTWAEFEGIVNFAQAQVGEIDEIQEYWYASDAGSIPNFLNRFSPFYMGQNADGTPVNIGDVFDAADGLQVAKTVDNLLWDITGADRGIFDVNATKLRMYLGDEDRPYEEIPGVLNFLADSRVQTFARPAETNWVFGAREGGHAVNNDPDGGIYTAFNLVPGFLKAAGMTVGRPQILSANTAVGGGHVDLTIALPNGGNLTTIRALEGRADPVTPPDDYQPVIGFEVKRAADLPADKLAIVPTTATSYAAKYRGSVAIIDAGTGTGLDRTGTVRITPEVPFGSGDQLFYLLNDPRTLVNDREVRRAVQKTWLNNLIEHVPAWRDTSAVTRFPGLAVTPLVTPITLDASAPTTNPLGTPVILNGAQGDNWSTEVNNHETVSFTPSGNDAIYVVASIGDISAPSKPELASATIGAALRTPGTGTPLILISDEKKGRCRVVVFRVETPVASEQTVEIGYAAMPPGAMRILVLQIPNAAAAAPVTVDLYDGSLSKTTRTHSPTVASANNGVLYIQAKVASAAQDPITSTSDSISVYEGFSGVSTTYHSNYLMIRWKVPGAPGIQSETFTWTTSTAKNKGVAIQLEPRP